MFPVDNDLTKIISRVEQIMGKRCNLSLSKFRHCIPLLYNWQKLEM